MRNRALAEARKKKGLTQEELGNMLGYSKAAVSNWESGYSNPSLSDAFKISKILDEDINNLFFGLKVQDFCITGDYSLTKEVV